ncbi:M23 family metallopeptidase [Nocardioides sp. BP30]|uniref:M23 family metallopeptidase n=1 Tax=Nocardioides sp. BP30 TaxID=3036374 RepID=UPI002468F2CC|nr:M23 family metallopeptidase [Nocardioides sp. BP30]WGL53638.1 M23 family metallopeptidase [Nocardioides sp. BP30]
MLRTTLAALVLAGLALGAGGCGSGGPLVAPTRTATSAAPPVTPAVTPPVTPPVATVTPTATAHRETDPDPRWRFYTADHRWYTSPWFVGSHRIMIGFGCNGSPWYDHDPRCPGTEGFHHGIDVAMPCGTPIRAGRAGTVLPTSAPGAPGPAYGVHPLRLRIIDSAGAYDVVIGHARRLFVRPGERVAAGRRIALASDSGAPDGCHLHFEVRPPGGSYTSAIDPVRWLDLTG